MAFNSSASWRRPARLALSVTLSLGVLLLALHALDGAHSVQARQLAAPDASLGVCPNCTYKTIQAAINAASTNDVIHVAGGTYTGTMSDYSSEGAFYLTATLVLTKNISLLGGYDPADLSIRDPSAFTTTVLGPQLVPGPVIGFINGATATVDGFWLTGSLQNARGGGVVMAGAAPTLSNNHIVSNHVTAGGGGIYVGDHTTPTIVSNVIAHNASDTGGGAIYVTGVGTRATLLNNSVLSNTASSGDAGGILVTGSAAARLDGNAILDNSGSNGAGLSIDQSATVSASNNWIAGNVTLQGSGGGASAANNATASLSGNTIVSNTGRFGGGFAAVSSATITLSHNYIAFNQSPQGFGGGVLVNGATAYLDGNTLAGNAASGNGGGVAVCCEARTVITGNTVITNSGLKGGGLSLLAPTTVVDNLIRANTAPANGDGGGIYLEGPGSVLSANQILSNSAPAGGGVELGASAVVTAVNNMIAYNTATQGSGGGWLLKLAGSSANLLDNSFIANAATNSGGGIFMCCGSTAFISGNTIEANTALFGAGIGVNNGVQALIRDNLILANTTLPGGNGGGLEIVDHANVALLSNRILSNMSAGAGGVSVNTGSIVTIANNRINLNSSGDNGGGGGVRIHSSAVVVQANTFETNTADSGGGLLVTGADNVLIDSNTFIANRAVRIPSGFGHGGGIYILDSPLGVTVTNNVLARNSVSGTGAVGSGLFAWQSSPAVVNNTFAFNGDPSFFGSAALWFDGVTTGTTLIRNNIVVGHRFGIFFVVTDTLPIVDHNDVFSTTGAAYFRISPGAGAISADPLFVNPSANDFHLRPGSPAINAGSNTGAPPRDHDGFLRPQQSIVDMGAFEFPGLRIFLPLIRR